MSRSLYRDRPGNDAIERQIAEPVMRYVSFRERFGPLPELGPITARIADLDDEWLHPELAIARAYNRGETPAPELIARANARAEIEERL